MILVTARREGPERSRGNVGWESGRRTRIGRAAHPNPNYSRMHKPDGEDKRTRTVFPFDVPFACFLLSLTGL